MSIDCQISKVIRNTRLFYAPGDKGLQSNSSTIHTYCGLNDMRDTVKTPLKKLLWLSILSLLPPHFPSPGFSVLPWNVSCYHVCFTPVPTSILSFPSFCTPNTDLPRDDTHGSLNQHPRQPWAPVIILPFMNHTQHCPVSRGLVSASHQFQCPQRAGNTLSTHLKLKKIYSQSLWPCPWCDIKVIGWTGLCQTQRKVHFKSPADRCHTMFNALSSQTWTISL